MLNAVGFGALWGAVIGKYFTLDPNLFECLRVSIVFLFVTSLVVCNFYWKKFFYRRFVSSCLLAAISCAWTCIHNPEFASVYDKKLTVLWSLGCAESDHEILVHDDRQVFLARGAAMEGDFVELPRGDIRSRFFMVKIFGFRANRGVFCEFFAQLRSEIYEALDGFPLDVRTWLSGFVLGKNADVQQSLIGTFRNVGLLHILVLSGGHLSVIAGLLLFILRVPFLIPYLLKNLGMEKWIIIWNITSVVTCAVLFLFCAIVGFSPTVQRAFLSFVVCQIFPMLGIAQNPKTRIRLTFCFQAGIFPVNLLSMSLILSWTGSLVLMAFFESTYLKSLAGTCLQAAKIQLFFLGSTLIFFGQAGILSPLANLVGLPVFGVLLPLDLLALLLNFPWLNNIVITANRAVIDAVRWFEFYQSSLPISYISLPAEWTIKATYGRLLIVLTVTVLYLLSGVRRNRSREHVTTVSSLHGV
jgi:ComEC/Rec2-related protein